MPVQAPEVGEVMGSELTGAAGGHWAPVPSGPLGANTFYLTTFSKLFPVQLTLLIIKLLENVFIKIESRPGWCGSVVEPMPVLSTRSRCLSLHHHHPLNLSEVFLSIRCT